MKLVVVLVGSLLYLVLLVAVHWCHIRFFTVNVVLYSAVLDVIIATAIGTALLCVVPWFRRLGTFERAQLIAIWLLAGYAMAISLPTVIDRSLSFYILEKIDQRGGGIRFDRFEDVFNKEYVKEHRLVDVRLTEQLQSKTIEIVNECVRLTDRGRQLVKFSRWYRKNFLPAHRLLMGGYTDDLVDPFRNGVPAPDYGC